MAYLGNVPAEAYSSIDKQVITGDGGASYTLDHSVANENEIEVFVNNVRQEPSVAYTVSGTALTMTGNVESSDDFYVVFQGKAIQTVVPPDLTVDTAKIKDDAVTTAKIADDAVVSAAIADDAVKLAHINEDFYKEGTSTLSLRDSNDPSGGNASSTTPSMYWTKVGRVVYFHTTLANIDTTGLTASLVVYVHGLPFTPKSGVGNAIAHCLTDTVFYSTGRAHLAMLISHNDYAFFRMMGDGVADDNMDWQNLTDGVSDISVSGFYYTDD